MERLNSGEIKDYLQNHVVCCHHWSDEKWKKSMAVGGGHKKIFQYCTDSSRTILHLRALQGHSGRNLIDPSLQDNVVIPDVFFKYIYLPGGQNLSKKTDSILSSCGSYGQRTQGS